MAVCSRNFAGTCTKSRGGGGGGGGVCVCAVQLLILMECCLIFFMNFLNIEKNNMLRILFSKFHVFFAFHVFPTFK